MGQEDTNGMALGTSDPTDILSGQQDMSSGAILSKRENSSLSLEQVSGELTLNIV